MAKDSCIEADDPILVKGYPVHMFRGGSTTMARHYYHLSGRKIPPDHLLVRTCKNFLCINPAHMKVVKKKDLPKHITYATGDRRIDTKLSEKQLDTMRKLRENGESVRNLAQKFNVSTSLIYKILQGVKRKNG